MEMEGGLPAVMKYPELYSDIMLLYLVADDDWKANGLADHFSKIMDHPKFGNDFNLWMWTYHTKVGRFGPRNYS